MNVALAAQDRHDALSRLSQWHGRPNVPVNITAVRPHVTQHCRSVGDDAQKWCWSQTWATASYSYEWEGTRYKSDQLAYDVQQDRTISSGCIEMFPALNASRFDSGIVIRARVGRGGSPAALQPRDESDSFLYFYWGMLAFAFVTFVPYAALACWCARRRKLSVTWAVADASVGDDEAVASGAEESEAAAQPRPGRGPASAV